MVQHCTLVLSLNLHDLLDNERKMEGQSLLLISFTLHNFYFIQLEIIFIIGKREVLLHTFFDICGGFVLRSVTKISPILGHSSFLQKCFI
jgi:hypothetical protein